MRDVKLVRAKIVMNNVTWQRVPGTTFAHLRIAGFSQGVSTQTKQALTEMKQQGVTAVILDLRKQPRRLLGEAVNTTSQFLASGDVLLEKDAQGQTTHVAVRPGGAATQMPLVVLVNGGSASASEIVAGALQDAHRATVIGETTFGTGTVLSQFPLSDGSALMLAIQEWLTPAGRVIWHKGIVPDKAITLEAAATLLTPGGRAFALGGADPIQRGLATDRGIKDVEPNGQGDGAGRTTRRASNRRASNHRGSGDVCAVRIVCLAPRARDRQLWVDIGESTVVSRQ